ncbi:hypothetical protein [Novosphingobium sp.]|uniref:hypothetical protein n=1 Tax=Novosphingobium sp. TaxID=1874826 RepID=UPI002FDFDA27
MDLNQLLYHHQIALIEFTARSKRNRDAGSRFDLVRHYATRIARLQKDMGWRPAPNGHELAIAEPICLPEVAPDGYPAVRTSMASHAERRSDLSAAQRDIRSCVYTAGRPRGRTGFPARSGPRSRMHRA